MVILVSAVSLITTIIGLYYIGEKDKRGFIYHTVSVSCQAWLFYIEDNWFLIIQMIILIIFNIRNYIKWNAESRRLI